MYDAFGDHFRETFLDKIYGQGHCGLYIHIPFFFFHFLSLWRCSFELRLVELPCPLQLAALIGKFVPHQLNQEHKNVA